MKLWWCTALREAWDTETHDGTPCDVALRRYGVGGVTDDKEHARCGWMRLIPDNPETVDRIAKALRSDWDSPPYFPWDQLPEEARDHLIKRTEKAAQVVLTVLDGEMP